MQLFTTILLYAGETHLLHINRHPVFIEARRRIYVVVQLVITAYNNDLPPNSNQIDPPPPPPPGKKVSIKLYFISYIFLKKMQWSCAKVRPLYIDIYLC